MMIFLAALSPIVPELLRAQSLPNGDWLFQTFDSNICGWIGLSDATLTFDPSQDNTGNGGGSCHVSADFSQNGTFLVSSLNIDCCICESDVILETSNYVSLDFDVKWDNSSTVPLAYFNTNAASSGILIAAETSVGRSIICNNPVIIPDAATNGWVHISGAISSQPGNIAFTGVCLESTNVAYGTGAAAAFWLDNVELISHTSKPIVSVVRGGGGHFILSWTAPYGTTYNMLKSTNMANWTTVATGYPNGGTLNSPLLYTDSVASDPHAFYRISSQ